MLSPLLPTSPPRGVCVCVRACVRMCVHVYVCAHACACMCVYIERVFMVGEALNLLVTLTTH